MNNIEVKRLAKRLIELGRVFRDGTLRIIVFSGNPIPTVDIFLTEDEFVENANLEFQEFDCKITRELFRVLRFFGFLPRAGFLSNRIKLLPHSKPIQKAIDEKDENFLEKILVRKRIVYKAQKNGLLSCKDDLKYIGVRSPIAAFSYDLSQCRGWQPIYLLSQIDELKKLYFQVADKAIKGIIYYKSKLSEFKVLVESSGIREETIQVFLKENSWIFGTEYIKVKSKMPLSHEFVVDFLLQKFDGSWEVAELELPSDTIFTRRIKLGAKATTAIGQVQSAQEFIAKNYEFLKTAENIDVYKPKGLVVIGYKLTDEEKERLEVINKSYTDIAIVTYSDLLEKSGKQIEMLSKLYPS